MFHLAEHRFDYVLALGIANAAIGSSQLVRHALLHCGFCRSCGLGGWRLWSVVLVATGGDVWIEIQFIESFDVGFAEVSRVGAQLDRLTRSSCSGWRCGSGSVIRCGNVIRCGSAS